MKRLLLVSILTLFGFVGLLSAQDKSKSMIQERVAYIKNNLTLSGAENNSFWKVYEQYLGEEIKIMDTYKKNLANQGINLGVSGTNKEIIASMSDKQITYMQDQKFELRKDLLNLQSTYHAKFKKILTPRHLQDMYDLEYKYKRELTKKKKEVKNMSPVNGGKKKR